MINVENIKTISNFFDDMTSEISEEMIEDFVGQPCAASYEED
jgi:hypothetical protein